MDYWLTLAIEARLWLPLLVVLFATIISSAWFKGKLGEFIVRLLTDFGLDRGRYHPLHDVILETPDGSTQIDHILVSAYGIFVIETKHYRGWIFGNANAKKWTQVLYKKKFTLQNPLQQNYKHCMAVQNILEVPAESIISVVVFSGSAKFKTPMPGNVLKSNKLLAYIKSRQTVIFDDAEIELFIQRLKSNTLTGFWSARSHVSQLKKNAKQPLCPSCGVEMVRRQAGRAKNAGKAFWGCSNFPRCRLTKQIN
ncbi:MAG: NERD domain-containing protein [Pseudomonadales bacterium]